jgi:hypothetical protein
MHKHNTNAKMVMGEIGSNLWQFHDWPILKCPKELSHVKVPEKEILHWIFNLRKHLQGVWEGNILFGYDFQETYILCILSPSSVSNNVKETYGVPPGSSRFLAYVKV